MASSLASNASSVRRPRVGASVSKYDGLSSKGQCAQRRFALRPSPRRPSLRTRACSPKPQNSSRSSEGSEVLQSVHGKEKLKLAGEASLGRRFLLGSAAAGAALSLAPVERAKAEDFFEEATDALSYPGSAENSTNQEAPPTSETVDAPAEAPPEPTIEAPAPVPSKEEESCTPVASSSRYQVQEDGINACAYEFPASLPLTEKAKAGFPPGFQPSWVLTRAPERYSSAAPLSPDARLRIVSERLFVAMGVTVSVAVCPPNTSFLQLPPPPQGDALPPVGTAGWSTLNVARSVLADRTSPRMTTAQRLQETVVGNTASRDFCGVRYFYYEFLQARSPSSLIGPNSQELFRHSYSATAEREGYLYTITASCLDPDWALLSRDLKTCVDSFRLVPTSTQYVPPYKDPWRFW